jgi:hypothetical protein
MATVINEIDIVACVILDVNFKGYSNDIIVALLQGGINRNVVCVLNVVI